MARLVHPGMFLVALLLSQAPAVRAEVAPRTVAPHDRLIVVYESERQAYDQFLRRLGFEDWVTRIVARQALPTTRLERRVLAQNKRRFAVFNDVRELVAITMGEIEMMRVHPEYDIESMSNYDKLIALAADMAALQPVLPAAGGRKGNAERRLAEAIENHLAVTTTNWMNALDLNSSGHPGANEMLMKMLAGEFSHITFTSEQRTAARGRVGVFQNRLASAFRMMYRDGEMGQTRLLGSALVAALLRHARVRKLPWLEQRLRGAVQARGVAIENLVGDESFSGFVLEGREGVVRIDVKTGDFLVERSRGVQAAAIPAGVLPARPNRKRARADRLLGPLAGPFLAVDPDPQNETMIQRWRRQAAVALGMEQGFSHVGTVQVRRDAETGLTRSLIIDIYPHFTPDGYRMEGGVRPIDVFQFALPGPFASFGRSRYDARKFRQAMQTQLSRGYQEIAWVGEREPRRLTDYGKRGANTNVNTLIARGEFDAVHRNPDTNAWFSDVMQRVTDEMLAGIAERPLAFAYGMTDYVGRAYCSKAINLAALRAVGIDLQLHPDEWHPATHLAQRMGNEEAKSMRLERRIIAPAGYWWQPMTETGQAVIYRPMSPSEQVYALFGKSAVATNPATLKLIMKIGSARRKLRASAVPSADMVETVRGLERRVRRARPQRVLMMKTK